MNKINNIVINSRIIYIYDMNILMILIYKYVQLRDIMVIQWRYWIWIKLRKS